jgi:hypothetical protein
MRGLRLIARGARFLLGLCGILVVVLGFALSVDQGIALMRDGLSHAPNEPTPLAGFIVFAAMTAVGAGLAWWGLGRGRHARASEDGALARAILLRLAESGCLTETQLVLQTSLEVKPLRAALERLRVDGLVEVTLTEDGVLAYRVIGIPRPFVEDSTRRASIPPAVPGRQKDR